MTGGEIEALVSWAGDGLDDDFDCPDFDEAMLKLAEALAIVESAGGC